MRRIELPKILLFKKISKIADDVIAVIMDTRKSSPNFLKWGPIPALPTNYIPKKHPGKFVATLTKSKGIRTPLSSKNEDASKPWFEPVNVAVRISTIITSAAPLASPIGNNEPAIAAFASVVGLPSASTAQPSGIGSPLSAASLILPRATFDVDKSTTIGGLSFNGHAKAIGFVP